MKNETEEISVSFPDSHARRGESKSYQMSKRYLRNELGWGAGAFEAIRDPQEKYYPLPLDPTARQYFIFTGEKKDRFYEVIKVRPDCGEELRLLGRVLEYYTKLNKRKSIDQFVFTLQSFQEKFGSDRKTVERIIIWLLTNRYLFWDYSGEEPKLKPARIWRKRKRGKRFFWEREFLYNSYIPTPYYLSKETVGTLSEEDLEEEEFPYPYPIEDPVDLPYSGGEFGNHSSLVGFIRGEYSSVDEVIRQDTEELSRVGGSFDEIADLMKYLMEQGIRGFSEVDCPSHIWDEWRDSFIDRYGEAKEHMEYYLCAIGELHNAIRESPLEGQFRGIGLHDHYLLLDKAVEGRFPGTTSHIYHVGGLSYPEWGEDSLWQHCPFAGCDFTWRKKVEYLIFNNLTERLLLINPGTEHLARVHHLLEKGNGYGISAAGFYDHFGTPMLQVIEEQKDLFQLGKTLSELSPLPMRDRFVIAQGFNLFQERVDIRAGDIVLDLGCGMGSCVVWDPTKRLYWRQFDFSPDKISVIPKLSGEDVVTTIHFQLSDVEHIHTLPDNSADVIICSCIINPTVDKEVIFKEAFRILRPGGRLVDADIITTGALPVEITHDSEVYTYLSKALTKEEYNHQMQEAGFEEIKVTIINDFKYLDNQFLNGIIAAQKPMND